MSLEELLTLATQLGISIDLLASREAAITKIVEQAVGLDDSD